MKSRLGGKRLEAPSADQIFDKYLQAVGGAQKAAAITSIVFKGTYQGYAEPKAPVDIYVKAPNQRTMIVHTDAGDRTTTFDGSNGWMAAPATDKPFPVIRLYRRRPGCRPAGRSALLSGGNQAGHNETASRFEPALTIRMWSSCRGPPTADALP